MDYKRNYCGLGGRLGQGDGVIRGFIVEKEDEGFTAPEMKGKHSLKASVTSELVFQDAKYPRTESYLM